MRSWHLAQANVGRMRARILFNMSVWESVEALSHYVYQSDHLGPLRDRKQWFERMDSPAMVLWWIESGQEPTVADAKAKLEQLAREGPTSEAFTFTKTFPAPASRDA